MSEGSTQLIIRSGGQTGVDRAALDAAMALDVSVAGWCPQGRLAEDGPISQEYPLIETESRKYSIRTEWNVRDADATLIISAKPLEGGTLLTEQYALKWQKPCLIFSPGAHKDALTIQDWIHQLNIKDLNVAGPRESKSPGIYKYTFDLLTEVLLGAANATRKMV